MPEEPGAQSSGFRVEGSGLRVGLKGVPLKGLQGAL